MLFDLSSPRRKTAVRIVFGGLAAIFAISFIGFGIGSDATGGLFDALGIGGDSNSSDNPEFQSQIDDANKALQTNPKDEKAFVNLVTYNILAGNEETKFDPQTGQTTFTDTALTFYDDGIAAWEKYLALKPKKPDFAAASQALAAYQAKFQTMIGSTAPDAIEVQDVLNGAVGAAAVMVEDQPSQNTYGTLVQFAYLAGDDKQAEKASQGLLDETPKADQKSAQKYIDSAQKQGTYFQKQLDKAAESQKTTPEQAFQNPIGDQPPPTTGDKIQQIVQGLGSQIEGAGGTVDTSGGAGGGG